MKKDFCDLPHQKLHSDLEELKVSDAGSSYNLINISFWTFRSAVSVLQHFLYEEWNRGYKPRSIMWLYIWSSIVHSVRFDKNNIVDYWQVVGSWISDQGQPSLGEGLQGLSFLPLNKHVAWGQWWINYASDDREEHIKTTRDLWCCIGSIKQDF